MCGLLLKHRLKESGSLIASFVDDTMRDMTKSESSLTIKSSPSVTPITLGMLARPTASKSALLPRGCNAQYGTVLIGTPLWTNSCSLK